MSRVAFLFPGQGAKRVHEALRFVSATESGRALCEAAARAADVPLDRVIARPSLLDRTDILQPMLAAISLAIVGRLSVVGIRPDIVLGHSAGEVAAWSAAGGIAPETAIDLCALRGRLMAREAAAHPGGMVALATSDPDAIDVALAVGRQAGALCLAAHNAPDETVLSGDEAAIRAVLAFAPTKATRVPTAGAWHSPAMEGALSAWRRALHETASQPLACDLVANRTGDLVSDGDDILSLLAEQLVRPVEWATALRVVRARADVVVTIGPGAVLRALWHRCFRQAATPEKGSPHGGPGGHDRPGSGGHGETGGAGLTGPVLDDAAPHPLTLLLATEDERARRPPTPLLATEDERALAETIATLRGNR